MRLGHSIEQGFPSGRDGLGQPWLEAVTLLSQRTVQSPARGRGSGRDDQVSPGRPKALATIPSNFM